MYINHVILDTFYRCRATDVNLINNTYIDMKIQSQRFPKIAVNSWFKHLLGPHVREKGMFSKLDNADMSSFIALSEGASRDIASS